MDNPSKKGVKSEAEIVAEARRKKEILDKVAQSNLPTKTILKELGISRSTYYSWLKRYEEGGDEGLLDSRSLQRTQDEGESAASAEQKAESLVRDAAKEPVGEEQPSLPRAEPTVVKAQRPVSERVRIDAGEKKEAAMTEERVQFDDGDKKRGKGAYALIAVFLLVVGFLLSISSSNYNTYRLQQSGETLTLWKGKFAPQGTVRVDSFQPLAIGDMDLSFLTAKKYVGADAALKAVAAFFMAQVDEEASKGEEADVGRMNVLLQRVDSMIAGAGAGSRNLSVTRFQLADKRVAVAEEALQKAYREALPVYQEALNMGLADPEELKTKIETLERALGLVPAEEQETAADKGESVETPEKPEMEGESTQSEADAEVASEKI